MMQIQMSSASKSSMNTRIYSLVLVNMNTVIDIKLKEGAVPYVAPIRRVAHALQEPLRLELEK